MALKDSDLAGATSLADFKDANIGVQIGTTSLDAVNDVIQPSSEPQVFDTSNDVVSALKNGQVDAVVVDVPTAFYLTAAQVPEATTVGQFPAPGGDQWGALLQKDSPLTALYLGGGRRAAVLGRAAVDREEVDERRHRRTHAAVAPAAAGLSDGGPPRRAGGCPARQGSARARDRDGLERGRDRRPRRLHPHQLGLAGRP